MVCGSRPVCSLARFDATREMDIVFSAEALPELSRCQSPFTRWLEMPQCAANRESLALPEVRPIVEREVLSTFPSQAAMSFPLPEETHHFDMGSHRKPLVILPIGMAFRRNLDDESVGLASVSGAQFEALQHSFRPRGLSDVSTASSDGGSSTRRTAFSPERSSPQSRGARNWYAQLAAELEVGGNSIFRVISQLRGRVRRASFDSVGCRVVQKVIEMGKPHETAALMQELRGHIRQAISSPHANYVIQKLVETMPACTADFVVEELQGRGAELSRHEFGCRLMCRLLEHAAGEDATVTLIDDTLVDAVALCNHSFGQHVMESVLEHGLPHQKHIIAEALCKGMPKLEDPKSLYIIEMAMKHCSAIDQVALVSTLMIDSEALINLAGNRRGTRLMTDILRVPEENSKVARRLLSAQRRLSLTPWGRQLLKRSQSIVGPKTLP